MFLQGEKENRGPRLLLAGLLTGILIAVAGLAPAAGAPEPASQNEGGVLPCKRKIALTAIYRINGKIRFEGVADKNLAGEPVKIYEIKTDELVATTRIRRDGTWWANSESTGRRYTWLTKFVAEAGGGQSRWRRLGQAVAIRGRTPVARSGPSGGPAVSRTSISVKVSGDSPDRLVVGVQTGCSRYEVTDRFKLKTGPGGVAEFDLPRPPAGEPYAIYRVSTEDGWKISPPIVVKPAVTN